MRVLVIPGLGERRLGLHRLALQGWRLYGAQADLVPLRWSDGSWESKRRQLLDRIDIEADQHGRISLVGLSAGGSAVLNAYASRADVIAGVVCVVAKVNRPEAMLADHIARSPAFVQSLAECAGSLAGLTASQHKRILSRYSTRDEIVPWPDAIIDGAPSQRTAGLNHNATIAWELTIGAAATLRFLRARLRE